ncbi:MAG TPA: dihydrofolate reductase family protein, partial [Streptosporangiaceae bacterium]|nr:dihydrofolate reductase family protein [Streptosporangiaceae bacterium]
SLTDMLDARAEVIPLPPPLRLRAVLQDLAGQGVGRLMAEGGARLGTRLLAEGLVDELHLAVAPFFVGEEAAPRFAGPAHYPHGPARPMVLAGVRELDGVVVLRYLLGDGAGEVARAEG